MTSTANQNAIQLKGSLFTLTVFFLQTTDIDAIDKQLQQLVAQTPNFFRNIPVVLDLQKLDGKEAVNFTQLTECLRHNRIVPIGIRGGSQPQQQAAITAGLAVMPNTKAEIPKIEKPVRQSAAQTPAPVSKNQTKVITQPVRSGQQIYARDADLIVLAPVSAGAELLADGHIHIYSALRGRALAGVTGNPNARIFCQSLEAELISIAGHYWISEDLQNSPVKQNVHIYLENDHLQVGSFT